MASPVAVAACDGYAPEFLEPALDAVLDAVGGLGRIVRPEQTVLLKPNLIAGLPPERGGTTHPAVLDSLCRRIRELGARPMIGDAPAWGGPRQVAEATGIAAVCVKYGEEFVYFDRHTRLDSRCPEVASHFHVDPRVLQADVVINVGKYPEHQCNN